MKIIFVPIYSIWDLNCGQNNYLHYINILYYVYIYNYIIFGFNFVFMCLVIMKKKC